MIEKSQGVSFLLFESLHETLDRVTVFGTKQNGEIHLRAKYGFLTKLSRQDLLKIFSHKLS